jgi:hypothetical protein
VIEPVFVTRQLFVSISAHGFGHAVQTAVVVNALWERWPDLRVTLRTTLPRTVLAGFFSHDLELIEGADDVGMVMASPLEVLADETADAFEVFHAGWEDRVEAEADTLARLGPDLVFANVPYLTLAAAARAGIPAVGMSSLNWAEPYWDYCGARPEAARIHAEIVAAYRQADLFLLPEPSMPMTWLPQTRTISPLARIGTPRHAELCAALGVNAEQSLVLVTFGGISGHRVLPALPREPDVIWLLQEPLEEGRPDVASIQALGWPFPDLLRSVDAVVTKPSYGTVTEATCNGARVLYLCRGDWAEETYIVDWLQRHAVCREIEKTDLAGDQFISALRALLAQLAKPGPAATGGLEAADALAAYLG